MKYSIEHATSEGKFALQSSHVKAVTPGPSGHVTLHVTPTGTYLNNSSFAWRKGNNELLLQLNADQIDELVEQDREAQQAFCSPCYDFGKISNPPAGCIRCQVIHACRKAGLGDIRKAHPVGEGSNTQNCLHTAAWIGMLFALWWSLSQWSREVQTVEFMRQDIADYRRRLDGCGPKVIDASDFGARQP